MRDSIIFYRSFYEAISELEPDVQAKVYTAIFEYSLNFNEVELSGLPKTIFTLIKPQLDANNKRYKNGAKGGRPNQKETEEEPKDNQDETKPEANKNVNDNDNVNDNVKDYRKVLLSEVSSDVVNQEYFEAAKSFQELFKQNLEEAGASTAIIDKAKGTWIDDIRLMIEADKYSMDDLRGAYVFLQKNEFWKKNILSTKKLRERMPRIKMEMHNGKSRGNNKEATSWDELAEIVKHSFEGS